MDSQNLCIQQLNDLGRSSPRFPDQLSALLDDEEYRNHISNLSDQDSAWLVQCLENVRAPPTCKSRFLKSAYAVDSRNSRSCQPRPHEMSACTQMDLWRPEDATDILHASRRSLNHRFSPGRLWGRCQYLRREHRRSQGLRQTGPGLFRRGHVGSSEGMVINSFHPRRPFSKEFQSFTRRQSCGSMRSIRTLSLSGVLLSFPFSSFLIGCRVGT